MPRASREQGRRTWWLWRGRESIRVCRRGNLARSPKRSRARRHSGEAKSSPRTSTSRGAPLSPCGLASRLECRLTAQRADTGREGGWSGRYFLRHRHAGAAVPAVEDDAFGLLVDIDLDQISGGELTLQDLDRQRALDELLDRPPQRPGAEGRVVTGPRQPLAGGFTQFHRQVVLGQPLAHFVHLQVDDALHLLQRERGEDDDFVDAVEELGAESGLERLLDLLLGLAVGARGVPVAAAEAERARAGDIFRAQVGGHD